MSTTNQRIVTTNIFSADGSYQSYPRGIYMRLYRKHSARFRALHMESYKRVNDRTRRHATNSRKPWTEQEIAMIWDTSYTNLQLAAKLGRSYQAIAQARVRYAVRKPADYVPNSTPTLNFLPGEKDDLAA